jgi:hypothetical protein
MGLLERCLRFDNRRLAVLLIATLGTGGCDRILNRGAPALPAIEDVRTTYGKSGVTNADIEYDGAVIVLRVRQPPAQLQRGGSLWAKVGPYIYLFNPATQRIMDANPAVSAVRVITLGTRGREIARATLPVGALNELTWLRTLNLLGHAVNEGTTRPATLSDLVRWGEQYTRFRYNPDFVPEAAGRTPEQKP